MLRWALHFASGNSLFSGVLVILIVWLLTLTRYRKYERTLRLASLGGVVFIALSATPLPWWAYAIWLVSFAIWFGTIHRSTPVKRAILPRERVAGTFLVLLSLGISALEVVTLFPHVPTADHQTMYVIGDSITAGLNEDDVLWPELLAEANGVAVVNLAQPGAMADSAMKQAELIPDGSEGIILIEIGGNDLLSGRSSEDFGNDLKQLLHRVSAPNRTVVIMELPLPPFKNEYGRIQRQLANQFDAILISKREFADVLGLADGTLDGIHLSNLGQQRMADVTWKYVKPLYKDSQKRSEVAR